MVTKQQKIIHLIAAARPNFMKIAPLYHALVKEEWAEPIIVHSGQHYDLNMSDVFFRDLQLPDPPIHLGVGSGSHAEQTGKVMIAYEKILQGRRPDLVVVVGDVNSTMAATLAAVKMGIKVAHLEAGLRSFDRTMPEEINRIVTDSLADYLWTPSPDGDENLKREGVAAEKIVRVGNIMIDSLEMMRPGIEAEVYFKKLNLAEKKYALVTLHRPGNVDSRVSLALIVQTLLDISKDIPVVFPLHPRTRNRLEQFGLLAAVQAAEGLTLLEPLSYIQFMSLVFSTRLVITDSGGVQEETTYLGIPCLTLRPNTERPITVQVGTNTMCKPEELAGHVGQILTGSGNKKNIPEFWDGHTAARVVTAIKSHLAV